MSVQEIRSYLSGHRIAAEGIFPDKWQDEAFTKIPYNTNVTELQRLLGMVKYLGKFIPNLFHSYV